MFAGDENGSSSAIEAVDRSAEEALDKSLKTAEGPLKSRMASLIVG